MTDDINIVDMLEEMNLRLHEAEVDIEVLKATPPAGEWAQSVDWLLRRWVTRRNAMTVAGTIAAIYVTYFAAAAVNAPLT
jgi:hypothetical protein